VQDHVTKSHDVGTIQYIEWLILISRVQPSFIAGVIQCALSYRVTLVIGTLLPVRFTLAVYSARYLTGREVCVCAGGSYPTDFTVHHAACMGAFSHTYFGYLKIEITLYVMKTDFHSYKTH
jgi:hypothetical protein